MSAMPDRRRPEEEERERAQQEEGSPAVGREAAPDDVPAHPSLGAPPRRDRSRPVFRSSQLDEGEQEEGKPPLRG